MSGARPRPWIAVVEDNPADVDLLRYALTGASIDADIQVLGDGDEAFKFLDQVEAGVAACPQLFVVDLNLPKKSGRLVLQRIRQSAVCHEVPIVVLSSSTADQDKEDSLRQGANRYITKPLDLDEYLLVGQILSPFLKGG